MIESIDFNVIVKDLILKPKNETFLYSKKKIMKTLDVNFDVLAIRLQIHELNWQFKWQFAFLISQLPNYVLWCLKWFQPSLLQSWKDQNDETENWLHLQRNKSMFVDTIFSSLYPMRNWQCGEAAFLLPLWTREITL